MALIHAVAKICGKLADSNWKLLFEAHGLDITKSTPALLEAELARALTDVHGASTVRRDLPGFEDFCQTGQRGVEPGSAARSLLYHAIASPNVVLAPDGRRLDFEIGGKPFPTLADLETLENYIFGVQKRSLQELATRANAPQLFAVTFAYEYRPATQTPHGFHADLVFSRTGVARVGTAESRYHPDLRGFSAEHEGEAHAIRVSPSRFGVFLSVSLKGDASAARPMRFQTNPESNDPALLVPDDQRRFFVPLHKLFPGTECVQGATLAVEFTARHVNDKILRVHQALRTSPAPAPVPPYRIEEGIAELSNDSSHGAGVLAPKPHASLIEEAVGDDGAPVTFRVKRDQAKKFDSLSLPAHVEFPFRSSPEYVHIRTKFAGGQRHDLNQLDDAALTAQMGKNYDAVHYIDFAGDGWVLGKVQAPQWAGVATFVSKEFPAYSLVTAPDFFPNCDQRELMEWTEKNVPASLRDEIWYITPQTLADQRLAPNLQLPGQPFVSRTTPSIPAAEVTPDSPLFTMTALVSMPGHFPTPIKPTSRPAERHSHLADDAAGIFAPGWDVAVDFLKSGGKRVWHAAAYGLGSPFPEDAKLCAALSTFWPGVAPDATREMEPPVGRNEGTVSPLTDEEVGQIGDLPWDGVPGPQLVKIGSTEFAEYSHQRRVDYVKNALQNLFTLRLTSQINASEYQRRVLAISFVYLALGFERTNAVLSPDRLSEERQQWKLFSFRKADPAQAEFQAMKSQTGLAMGGNVYRCELFPTTGSQPTPVSGNPFRFRLKMSKRFFLYVDPERREVAVRERSASTWRRGTFVV